jgi:hypothetical protein
MVPPNQQIQLNYTTYSHLFYTKKKKDGGLILCEFSLLFDSHLNIYT